VRRPLLLAKFAGDAGLWLLAAPLALWLRLEERAWNDPRAAAWIIGGFGLVKLAAIVFAKLPWQSWRRTSVRDLIVLIRTVGVTSVLLLLAATALQSTGVGIPRSVAVIDGMLGLLLLAGARLTARIAAETRAGRSLREPSRRVLIAGAGEAGTMLAREMLRHPEAGMHPIGYIDDDPAKQGTTLVGVPVLGTVADAHRIAAHQNPDEVLIAMPSAGGRTIRTIVEQAQSAGIASRIIPAIHDLLSGRISMSQLRNVELADLLRREPVELDVSGIRGFIDGRVVLVTGAGGSIGAEIVRQVLAFQPRRLLLYGHGENSLFQLERELNRTHPDTEKRVLVGDVRDREKLDYIWRTYHPQVVFHAAAHKHVPLMEANPDEAILNNVLGTRNLLEICAQYGIDRFINISSDKAVNPTSIMGASKRVAEMLVAAAAARTPESVFASVRFGNVLGSRGSVVPVFQEQIRRGEPITITDPEMTRYFMTIPEASRLVLQAAALDDSGVTYVLDMGEPVKIIDLARDLIRLSGLEPDVDLPIHIIGRRPGEKLFEELLTAEEGTDATRFEKIYIARKTAPVTELDSRTAALITAAKHREAATIRGLLAQLIPTYAAPQANPHAPAPEPRANTY